LGEKGRCEMAKVAARYACGHDATRSFDCRNISFRIDARYWPENAAKKDCPACNKARRVAVINGLGADDLREILIGLAGNKFVADAIDSLDGGA